MINWYDLGEDEPAQTFDSDESEDQPLEAVERAAEPFEPKAGLVQNVIQTGKFLNTFNQFLRGIQADSFRRERSKLQ